MSGDEAICRSCGSARAKYLGRIPESALFAGRRLPQPLPGGSLWRCLTCQFVFRHPLLPDHQYVDLYRQGSLNIWDSEQAREDFRLVRDYLSGLGDAPRSLVDIGCYTGQLLRSLPRSIRGVGVEASREAAAVAVAAGVPIVAESLDEFLNQPGRFDVITACDFIEHLPNPLEFLRQMRAHLRPGGLLVVTTGDCDTWLWQWSGSRYWYCQFPEHISFIGSRWVQSQPRAADFRLTTLTRFNYLGGGLHLPRILAAVANQLSPDFYGLLRRLAGRPRGGDVPPGNGALRDHMLCVFEAA
jgi:SAM-dependent methyltransferase